jgi:hypothetical protein
VGVRKEGGRKARALALVLSLFLLSSLLVWQGRPAGAAVYTQQAENVGWNSALLTARILYWGPQTLVRFQYKKETATDWEVTTPWKTPDNKSFWTTSDNKFFFCLLITGLQENTPYVFRAQENYENQVYSGENRKFRTLPSKPVATPLRVTLVDNGSALLSARIYYADNDNVTLQVEYRRSSDATWSTFVVSGYKSTLWENLILGLSPDNLYEWRLKIGDNYFIGENFRTFRFKTDNAMKYSGDLGLGSLSGWHGVRVENLPENTAGMKLELLFSSSSPSYHSVRVVGDNGGLLYASHFLNDKGRTKQVSIRFRKPTVKGENVYVELYDPVGFAFRGRGTDSSMPLTRSGIKYSYSYLDRTGKNLRYYDRACGLQVLEVYT